MQTVTYKAIPNQRISLTNRDLERVYGDYAIAVRKQPNGQYMVVAVNINTERPRPGRVPFVRDTGENLLGEIRAVMVDEYNKVKRLERAWQPQRRRVQRQGTISLIENTPSEVATMSAPVRLAMRYWNERRTRSKTAGEVRFIKDHGGDEKQWGWGSPGPTEREIDGDFKFKPGNLKPLAKTLRATLAAMGHALSAYDTFTRLKSAQVSPDGNLGGKGYIAKIADMRHQYMNVVEALSALSDTLYDEMHAPHWDPSVEKQSPREREQVKDIMDDVEEIRDAPEAWAEGEEEAMDGSENQEPRGKKASQTYDINHLKTNASEIAAEVVSRGSSTGWSGDTNHLRIIQGILADFNIGYVDDMHGKWSYVRGGSKFASLVGRVAGRYLQRGQ